VALHYVSEAYCAFIFALHSTPLYYAIHEKYGALGVAASWRECDKANREYKKDIVAAFYVFRTLTSKEVDDELATRHTLGDLETDDPIGLFAEIKAVVTLKCGGITLKNWPPPISTISR
jgi:hypothetical protein